MTPASPVGFERTGGRPNLLVHSAAWVQGLLWARVWADVPSQREVVLALRLQFSGEPETRPGKAVLFRKGYDEELAWSGVRGLEIAGIQGNSEGTRVR